MMENKRPLFLLEEELTYKLRGIFFKVSHEYGYLFKLNKIRNRIYS
jgi:hypothetical protein